MVSQTLAELGAPEQDHEDFWGIFGLKTFFILLKWLIFEVLQINSSTKKIN